MTPLSAIGWHWTPATLPPAWAALGAAHPQARPARVVEQHRSGYRVSEVIDVVHPAESLPMAARRQLSQRRDQPRGATGGDDWVLVENSVLQITTHRGFG